MVVEIRFDGGRNSRQHLHRRGAALLTLLGVGLCRAGLELLNDTCLDVLASDEEAVGLEAALREYLTMTVQFGCDQVLEIYEELGGEENVVDPSV